MPAPLRGFRPCFICCFCACLLFLFAFPTFFLAAPSPAIPSLSINALISRANSGEVAAEVLLGQFLIQVDPSTAGFNEALAWLHSSAEHHNPRAQFFLGYLFEKGHGVRRDYAQAAENYQDATLGGHRVAPNNLGNLYQQGLGVKKDLTKAVELYRLAAERGNAIAQYNLASSLDLGLGGTPDPAEALRWYRSAADQGFSVAQHRLGVLYIKAMGVARNSAEGARWVKLAAENRLPAAETDLGVLYESGRGLPLDYIASYAWFSRAVADGDRSAAPLLKSLAQLMTPKQIKQARVYLAASPALTHSSDPAQMAAFPNP